MLVYLVIWAPGALGAVLGWKRALGAAWIGAGLGALWIGAWLFVGDGDLSNASLYSEHDWMLLAGLWYAGIFYVGFVVGIGLHIVLQRD